MVTILALLCALSSPIQSGAPRESDHWTVERLRQPEGAVLEVGGMAVIGDRVALSTRRGEVWWLDGAFDRAAAATSFSLAAEGLQEPLGLLWHEGWLYAACRGELVRMQDADDDGRFENFETVSDAWPISGNYHEYNFGPALAPDGSFWITTNKPFGDEPFGRAKWRGFGMQILPDGTTTPRVAGLRSPAGIGTAPWGDLFYTDNQGEWCGASKLAVLEPGSFQGHPHGVFSTTDPRWPYAPISERDVPNRVLMPTVQAKVPTFRLPAVWFPYDEMGRSPSGFAWDQTEGKFGPFTGQLFVGDQYDASVMRVDLEEVEGVWQGACFPFRAGLPSGVIRVAFGPDGSLLAGMSDRGWGSRGAATDGVARLRYTGRTPFEVLRMRATPTGFRVEFTLPADTQTLAALDAYTFESYTYLLHEDYGSPEVDRGTPVIVAAKPAVDGRSVELVVDGLREGYVHELRLPGVRRDDGTPLLHPRAYYTLVRRPR
jgi:glucose/arabinose dehydrogenase